MNSNFHKVWTGIKDYTVIVFGLILYAFGWTGFLLTNEITTGGITGVSALIFFGTKIPVAVSYFTLNALLLIAAIRILGIQFCIRTIFGVIVTTLLLSFFGMYIKEPLISGEPFMSCIITDIIAAMINKYKEISLGRSILYCDFLIISSSYILFHSIEKIVFGIVVMAVMTYTCDMVINGIRASVQLLIFSDKWEELANHINEDLHRGVTVLDGMGWYSKKPRKVLVVLVKRTEANSLNRMIKMIDPQAFISQSSVLGVYGQGFDKIK